MYVNENDMLPIEKRYIQSLYLFEKAKDKKSRFDCTFSTQNYKEIEQFRTATGLLKLSVGGYQVNATSGRESKIKISGYKRAINGEKGTNMHITSIYTNDLDFNIGYGDDKSLKGCNLWIFRYNNDLTQFELFTLKDQIKKTTLVIDKFLNGEFDKEIELLKGQLISE